MPTIEKRSRNGGIACVCALLLAVACLLTPATRADLPAAGTRMCLDFDDTSEALELTIIGDQITGRWLNVTSDGNDVPILGIIRDGLPLPCSPGSSRVGENPQNPAKAGIACIWDCGCESLIAGWDWYVILDGLDGSLDIGLDVNGNDGPPGFCGADDIPYTVIQGPCPAAGWRLPEGPGMTLQEAIHRNLEGTSATGGLETSPPSGEPAADAPPVRASDGAPHDAFGGALAITGAQAETTPILHEDAKLLPSDGAPLDFFGDALAISGDRALVAADGHDAQGENSGATYVFERDGSGNWVEVAKLLASDGTEHDRFGGAVALSADRALVGAYGTDDRGFFSGSAYVFERDESGFWLQVAKLLASDGAEGDAFGSAVSLWGQRALVGAEDHDFPVEECWGSRDEAGSAYIFEHDESGNWVEVARLAASDGRRSDHFGNAVSISGDRALIGAHAEDDPFDNHLGSAYVFERDESGNWVEAAKLIGSENRDSQFGVAVSLLGDRALIGAPGNPESAYIFERDQQGNWSEVVRLVGEDAYSENFGTSVSLSGDWAVIGASEHTDSAYVFKRDQKGYWSVAATLLASDWTERDQFGDAVSLSGQRVLVGASRRIDAPSRRWFPPENVGDTPGAAYVFSLDGPATMPIGLTSPP